MGKHIRVLVIDDHPFVRDGLRHLLGQEEDIEVVGQDTNTEDVISQVEIISPDIVLMDIKMPGIDGIELTRQINEKALSCKVIMLTLFDQFLNQAIEVGAKGYLLKDIKREQLAQAIRKVQNGEVVIHESIASQLRLHLKGKRDRKTKEIFGTFVKEVKLVIPPPVDIDRLTKFARKIELILDLPVAQIVGSRQEGIIITIIFEDAVPLTDIIKVLDNIPEVEAIEEEPLTEEMCPIIHDSGEPVLKEEDRPRITLFIRLVRDRRLIPSLN